MKRLGSAIGLDFRGIRAEVEKAQAPLLERLDRIIELLEEQNSLGRGADDGR